MATFTSLPVELLLDIIQYLVPQSDKVPIPGVNAAWNSLQKFTSLLAPVPDWSLDRIRSPENDALPFSVPGSEQYCEEPHPEYYSVTDILALRLTCRYFSQICLPFIYHDLNFIKRNSRMDTGTIHRISYFVLSPYWTHIRTVRAFVDGLNASNQTNAHIESTLSKFLESCQNITSLALYYHNPESQIPNIIDKTLHLIKNGQLTAIGIYSSEIVNSTYEPSSYREVLAGPIELIGAISKSHRARKAIRRLDIAAPWIPEEIWDLIRSEMTSLESLTIRRALRKTLKRIWESDQQAKWAPNNNLTHLHLLNCQPACAAHIPPLVRHFGSLRELTVSTCGQTGDVSSPSREKGWSKHSTALCNTRKPLEIFHIEHMEDWEVGPMGVIPTRVLVVTNVRTNHLFNSFKDDLELFPGVKVVRIAPQVSEERRRVVATTATNTSNMINGANAAIASDFNVNPSSNNAAEPNTNITANVVFVGDAATIAAADATIASEFPNSDLANVLDLPAGNPGGDQEISNKSNADAGIPSGSVKQIVLDPFEALMRARNIELRLDAEPIWRCGCSGSTGY